MHMSIGIIAEELTQAQAITQAEYIANELVNKGIFDYFTKLKTYNLQTQKGLKALEQMLEWQKEDFIKNLEAIRAIITTYSNDDLIAENDNNIPEKFKIERGLENLYRPSWLRYFAYGLGQYEGSNIRIYDEFGNGIRDKIELECLKENIAQGIVKYMVTFDVHY